MEADSSINDKDMATESNVIGVENAPTVGMEFESDAAAGKFYYEYAKCMGFSVRIRQSKATKRLGKQFVHFACNKEGYTRRAANALARKPNLRCGCEAGMKVKKIEPGKWVVCAIKFDHKHPISPRKGQYSRCHKQLDERTKRRLELNSMERLQRYKTYQASVAEAEGDDQLIFGERECRNHLNKIRQLKLGANSPGLKSNPSSREPRSCAQACSTVATLEATQRELEASEEGRRTAERTAREVTARLGEALAELTTVKARNNELELEHREDAWTIRRVQMERKIQDFEEQAQALEFTVEAERKSKNDALALLQVVSGERDKLVVERASSVPSLSGADTSIVARAFVAEGKLEVCERWLAEKDAELKKRDAKIERLEVFLMANRSQS